MVEDDGERKSPLGGRRCKTWLVAKVGAVDQSLAMCAIDGDRSLRNIRRERERLTKRETERRE